MPTKYYDQLSQIAPTVVGEQGWANTTWDERVSFLGRALGVEAQANEQIDITNTKIESFKTTYPGMAGKTFSLSYRPSPENIVTIYQQSDPAVLFFDELGLTLSEPLQQLTAGTATGSGQISMETLNLLDADLMIIAYDNPDDQQSLEASSLFQQLEAVKADNYFPLDLRTVVALRGPSLLGLRWALDELEPLLREAFGS